MTTGKTKEWRITQGRRAVAAGWAWRMGAVGFDPERGGFAIYCPVIGSGVSPWKCYNFCDLRDLIPDFAYDLTERALEVWANEVWPGASVNIETHPGGHAYIKVWEARETGPNCLLFGSKRRPTLAEALLDAIEEGLKTQKQDAALGKRLAARV